MLAYFFHHGLVVTFNSDDDVKSRQRAYEIAAERLAPLNETPALMGHASLPADGVVCTWDRHDEPQEEDGGKTLDRGDVEDIAQRVAADECNRLGDEFREELDRRASEIDRRIDEMED